MASNGGLASLGPRGCEARGERPWRCLVNCGVRCSCRRLAQGDSWVLLPRAPKLGVWAQPSHLRPFVLSEGTQRAQV